MDKKTQTTCALAGFFAVIVTLRVLQYYREKKEREVALRMAKATEEFLAQCFGDMHERLWKKAEERVRQRHEEA